MADTQISLKNIIAPPFYALHRDVRREGHNEYWLRGGRGSGKSCFASDEITLGIINDPRANAIIYRKVAATLRESVYAQMLWSIDHLGLSRYFRAKVSPMELTYIPTGQRILFRGADDPSKSKSIKLREGYFKFLWFEELSEFSGIRDIDTIKASVIRGGGHAMTFCTYNPPVSAGNWVNTEALRHVDGRIVHHSDYRGLPREWLGESFIATAEAMQKTNERAYRHMYLGEVTGTGGQVFDNINLRDLADAEIAACDKRYYGLDFGFAVDPDAFVCWHYDKARRRLIAIDEFYSTHTPIDTLAEAVKKRAGNSAVTCDSADPRMISELRKRGVQAVGAKKGPGSVEHGMRWLQDIGEIIIDPKRCPNTAREFSTYEYRRDSHDNFIADYPDADNHTIDATRYALNNIIAYREAKTSSGIRRYL